MFKLNDIAHVLRNGLINVSINQWFCYSNTINSVALNKESRNKLVDHIVRMQLIYSIELDSSGAIMIKNGS